MFMMAVFLLASCSRPIENEEAAVLKVAVHDETYKEKLNEGTEKAKEAIIEIMKNGVDSAMNQYN